MNYVRYLREFTSNLMNLLNFRHILIFVFALLMSRLCISSSSYSVESTLSDAEIKNHIMESLYSHTEMDDVTPKIKYYKDGIVEQNPLLSTNTLSSSNAKSTAEICNESLLNEGYTTVDDSMDTFYRKIARHDFSNNRKCKNFQALWTKNRTETDCYETIDLGKIANIKIQATTLADPKAFSILEKFMKEVIELTYKSMQIRELHVDSVLRDRPTTLFYLILESIRSMHPKGISKLVKYSLKELERVINKNLPLFKDIRDENNNMHTIDMLYLIKKDTVEDVEDFEDFGAAMLFIDDGILSNEKLILRTIWENLDSLFKVCRKNKAVEDTE